MEFIIVNEDNLMSEHICCALADKQGENQVAAKKAWLAQMFPHGLTFVKGDVRGKVFIEALPAEEAWCPLEAPGYLFINCFWVAGKYQGQGIGRQLLEKTAADAKAKGKIGLLAVAAAKKKPFLHDGGFLGAKGFQLADKAPPYFQLLYLPFSDSAAKPRFRPCAKEQTVPDKGFVLFYGQQCPFTAKYAPLAARIAGERHIPFRLVPLTTKDQAQAAPTPYTTYTLFYDGGFVTHEILSEKKLAKLFDAVSLPEQNQTV